MQHNFKIISDTIIPGQKNMWLCKDHLLLNYFPSIFVFLCTVYFGSNLRTWRSWDSSQAKTFTVLKGYTPIRCKQLWKEYDISGAHKTWSQSNVVFCKQNTPLPCIVYSACGRLCILHLLAEKSQWCDFNGCCNMQKSFLHTKNFGICQTFRLNCELLVANFGELFSGIESGGCCLHFKAKLIFGDYYTFNT